MYKLTYPMISYSEMRFLWDTFYDQYVNLDGMDGDVNFIQNIPPIL